MACLITLAARVNCAVDVPSDIIVDTVLAASNTPYTVSQSVVVYQGATLTVEPGVVLRFAAKTALSIADGTLIAVGTATSPITMTSIGEVGAETNRWGYVGFGDLARDAVFGPTGYVSGCYLSHVVIENAGGTAIEGAVHAEFSAPYLDSVVIRNCAKGGVFLRYANAATVAACTITNNCNKGGGEGGGGIIIINSTKVRLISNTISHNLAGGGAGIHGDGADGLVAVSNNISYNSAVSEGGGVFLSNSGGYTWSNNVIRGNTATKGGAMCLWGGNGTCSFNGDQIIENSATQGGGIYAYAGSTVIRLSSDQHHPTTIMRNKGFNVYNDKTYGFSANPVGPGNIDASSVWWGTANNSRIAAQIFDFHDDASKGKVFTTPPQTNPPEIIALAISGIIPGTNQNVTLTWEDNRYESYTILHHTSLTEGVWSNVCEAVFPQPMNMTTFSLPGPEPAHFFRLCGDTE